MAASASTLRGRPRVAAAVSIIRHSETTPFRFETISGPAVVPKWPHRTSAARCVERRQADVRDRPFAVFQDGRRAEHDLGRYGMQPVKAVLAVDEVTDPLFVQVLAHRASTEGLVGVGI